MLNATKSAAGFTVIVEQIVEKQIKRNYPPETAETYQRLVNDSFTDAEALRLISMAVQVELFRLMRFGEAFNHARFIGNLHGLPDLPDID
ncbi:MAG: hypothetical protein M9948_00895 [Lentimicrobium sp.]|nr:hypothetical protein [Lentimicrobium sp.]HPG34315.1 hypothetical protein [Lentimicrobium sp.]